MRRRARGRNDRIKTNREITARAVAKDSSRRAPVSAAEAFVAVLGPAIRLYSPLGSAVTTIDWCACARAPRGMAHDCPILPTFSGEGMHETTEPGGDE